MRKFIQSFVYAWNGIRHGIGAERNAKVHVMAAIIVIVAGFMTGLSQIRMVHRHYFDWRNAGA